MIFFSQNNNVVQGYSVAEASKRAGICRTTIYSEIAQGHLKAKKMGRRTIITEQALSDWLQRLPNFEVTTIKNKEEK